MALMDLQEFRNEAERAALREELIEYRDILSTETSTLPGYEFWLDLVKDDDFNKLEKPIFSKSLMDRSLEM